MITAVIFDVDGTLVDSTRQHVRAWQDAFREFGLEVAAAKLQKQIGKGGDQMLPDYLDPEQLRRFGKQLSERKDAIYRERYRPEVKAFPRVTELLAQLRADAKRVAIATSGKPDDLEHYIALLGAEALVDVRATSKDAARTKPAPDIFLAALSKLEMQPQGAIAVGDSVWDAQSAAKAGLPTIGLLCGGYTEAELRGAGCIAVYREPAELLEQYAESPLTAS